MDLNCICIEPVRYRVFDGFAFAPPLPIGQNPASTHFANSIQIAFSRGIRNACGKGAWVRDASRLREGRRPASPRTRSGRSGLKQQRTRRVRNHSSCLLKWVRAMSYRVITTISLLCKACVEHLDVESPTSGTKEKRAHAEAWALCQFLIGQLCSRMSLCPHF